MVLALTDASLVVTVLVEASFVVILRAGVDILSDVESIVTPAIAVDGRENTGVVAHVVEDIDPDERTNMAVLLAFKSTQAALQSFCLNEVAPKNI